MDKFFSKDKESIELLINKHFRGENMLSINRLGGMTNHTYAVDLQSGKFVFRLPGEGTEKIINRRNEIISTKVACRLGIDSVLYIDEYGIKISDYIPEAITMDKNSLKESKNIQLLSDLLSKLHNSKIDTKVDFQIFAIAKDYETYIKESGISLFSDYDYYKSKVLRIKERVSIDPSDFTPCHNDPLCENWIKSNGKLYLVDWEYAGMNDPLWDIADVSIEAEYNDEEDQILLYHYFGHKPDTEIEKRFLANKIFIDFLWSLWGKTRESFEASMNEYAEERYERMKKNICELERRYD